MSMTAKDLAATSLRLTKAKDRDGWLALFAPDAVIEDPVGSAGSPADQPGHRGIEAIARFYDSTISTVEDFDYEIERCYVGGSEAALVITMHIQVGGGRMDMDVVNIYAATEDGLIRSLRSFWDGSRQGG
jgi:steroid Delta-isomerase